MIGCTREFDGRSIRLFDVDEEAARLKMFVLEQVFRRVEDPDRQPVGLPRMIGFLRRLDEEEALDDRLNIGEILLPVADILEFRVSEISRHVFLVQPANETLPRTGVRQNEDVIYITPIRTLEQRGLSRRRLRMTA